MNIPIPEIPSDSFRPAPPLALLTATDLLAVLFPRVESRPSESWLKAVADRGGIPSVKIGSRRFFDQASVETALRGQLQSAENPSCKKA